MVTMHRFWLLREGEHEYKDYKDFTGRSDAPVQIDFDLLLYFIDSLKWIPSFNPSTPDISRQGLDLFGVTIINKRGGQKLQEICLAWKHVFDLGPAQLRIRSYYTESWPFDEDERILNAMQLHWLGAYEYVEVEKAWLLDIFTKLAQYGEQAATGEYYILHLGI